MEFSITTMIVLSIILMAAGVLLLLLWPLISAQKNQSQGQSVTVRRSGGMVTVSDASGNDVNVIFEKEFKEPSEQVVPASLMSERAAEEEMTIIDELKDPRTSAQRKKAIEDDLLALGYKIAGRRQKPAPSVGKPDSRKAGQIRPQENPASTKPSEAEDSDDSSPTSGGVDEGLGEQEPQFDEFYAPSR